MKYDEVDLMKDGDAKDQPGAALGQSDHGAEAGGCMKIKVRIDVREDHISVRGNLIASGDSAVDTQCEDEVLARLAKGDQWAWCCVIISATVGEFTGMASLGGCSYINEEDFKKDGYYETLVDDAILDLRDVLITAADRGLAATRTLDAMSSSVIEREET